MLAALSVPGTGYTGQSVAYSVTPRDWSTVTTVWDFGDGSTANGTSVSHVFPNVGTYPVTVTVTDALGDVTTTPAEHGGLGRTARRDADADPHSYPDADPDADSDAHPDAGNRPSRG